MALLTLRSENPEFSYVISKNPASGVLAKEMRLGRVFGWFTPDRGGQEYNVWFKDSDTEVSYKTSPDESFEYLNVTRYSSAMFIINACQEFFSYTLKKQVEQDVAGKFENELVVNLMYIKDLRYVDIFTRYFNDFKVDAVEKAKGHYQVTIWTMRTVKDLISFVNLFAMFNVLKNEQDWFDVGGEGVVDKYLACMQNIDAPYFVRYVFKVNLLRGRNTFDKYRKQLETSARYDIKLVPGNSSMSRRDEVTKLLAFDRPIVDIGCGEGFYAHPLAKKLEGYQYHAVDKDPQCIETVKWRAENKQIENIVTYSDFAEVPQFDEPVDVLAVEVIEHMPMADAKKLMIDVLSTLMVNKLIITTPNVHFNVHYTDDESGTTHMRHDDHHFELTPAEFNTFVCELVTAAEAAGKRYVVSVDQIGDKVDGVGCSLMAVFTAAKAEEAVA